MSTGSGHYTDQGFVRERGLLMDSKKREMCVKGGVEIGFRFFFFNPEHWKVAGSKKCGMAASDRVRAADCGIDFVPLSSLLTASATSRLSRLSAMPPPLPAPPPPPPPPHPPLYVLFFRPFLCVLLRKLMEGS